MILPLVAATALAALGWPAAGRLRPAWGAGAAAVAGACGALVAVVVVAFAAALAGGSWPLALLAGAAVAASIGGLPGAGEPVRPAPTPCPESAVLRHASLVVLLAGAALFLAKLARAPLWSWDHYAIWGVKARRLLVDGALDLSFLSWPELLPSRPDHPLGLPLAWLAMTLGRRPDPPDFVLLHALAGVALLLVLRGAVRAATGSWTWGNLAAAAVAASPLFWDTEAVGLAEMPLALFATAGVAMLLDANGPRTAAAGGLALGFLPWLKSEGLPLAVLLLVAGLCTSRGAAGARRRVRTAAALACGAVGLAASAVGRFVLPEGRSFFVGDWWGRIVDRLPQLPEIAAFCFGELLAWDWLLLWPAFALGALLSLARRSRTSGALFAVVALQVAIYGATAVFTYLEPIAHLHAAFFRICAPLVPLGVLALAQPIGDHGAQEGLRASRPALPPSASPSPAPRRPPGAGSG